MVTEVEVKVMRFEKIVVDYKEKRQGKAKESGMWSSRCRRGLTKDVNVSST